MYYLEITLADHEQNSFGCCGGAGFETEEEWVQSWLSAPSIVRDEEEDFSLVLDKLDDSLSILDNKRISIATAERFLGIKWNQIKDKARKDIEQTRARFQKYASKAINRQE